MITFALTRSTRVEVVSELQIIFGRQAWQDILITRMEMAFTDAGGNVTDNIALWGHEDKITQELNELKII